MINGNDIERNIIKRYGEDGTTADVINLLQTCQNMWKVLAYKILKENIIEGIYSPKEEDIYSIYELEKVLIKHLELLVKRK